MFKPSIFSSSLMGAMEIVPRETGEEGKTCKEAGPTRGQPGNRGRRVLPSPIMNKSNVWTFLSRGIIGP